MISFTDISEGNLYREKSSNNTCTLEKVVSNITDNSVYVQCISASGYSFLVPLGVFMKDYEEVIE